MRTTTDKTEKPMGHAMIAAVSKCHVPMSSRTMIGTAMRMGSV